MPTMRVPTSVSENRAYEPIITALIDADGVDRNELEAMLRQALPVP
jgi:hypothetical protein